MMVEFIASEKYKYGFPSSGKQQKTANLWRHSDQ